MMPQAARSYVPRSALTCPATRGFYGQLTGTGVSEIIAHLAPALPEKYVEFDKKGRGDAVNHDLYGWDADQSVGVIQCRHAFRRYRDGYLNVHKTYVLCGFNETGEPFRHPVSAHTIRAASRKAGVTPASVVRAAQRWMWRVTDRQLDESRRQGDVLIVPHRGDPTKGAHQSLGTTAILAGTHVVDAELIVRIAGSDWLYAKRPLIRHTKRQHADTRAPRTDGEWFTIRAAYETEAWNFSVRLGD